MASLLAYLFVIFFLVPILAYITVKWGTAGYYAERQRWERTHLNQDDEKE